VRTSMGKPNETFGTVLTRGMAPCRGHRSSGLGAYGSDDEDEEEDAGQ